MLFSRFRRVSRCPEFAGLIYFKSPSVVAAAVLSRSDSDIKRLFGLLRAVCGFR